MKKNVAHPRVRARQAIKRAGGVAREILESLPRTGDVYEDRFLDAARVLVVVEETIDLAAPQLLALLAKVAEQGRRGSSTLEAVLYSYDGWPGALDAPAVDRIVVRLRAESRRKDRTTDAWIAALDAGVREELKVVSLATWRLTHGR